MTTTQRQIDAASAEGFALTRRAMAARMACKRRPLLLDAAASYKAAGMASLAAKLERLAEYDRFVDFQTATRA